MTYNDLKESLKHESNEELFDTLEYAATDVAYHYDLWYACIEELKRRIETK